MQRRTFLRTLGTGFAAGGALMMLGGCGKETPATEAVAATGETTIRVGVTAGQRNFLKAQLFQLRS